MWGGFSRKELYLPTVYLQLLEKSLQLLFSDWKQFANTPQTLGKIRNFFTAVIQNSQIFRSWSTKFAIFQHLIEEIRFFFIQSTKWTIFRTQSMKFAVFQKPLIKFTISLQQLDKIINFSEADGQNAWFVYSLLTKFTIFPHLIEKIPYFFFIRWKKFANFFIQSTKLNITCTRPSKFEVFP